MRKLYKLDVEPKRYWETWENGGVHTIHWGELGTRGETKEIKSGLLGKGNKIVQLEMQKMCEQGFASVDFEDLDIVIVEYSVDGFGTDEDLEKRHRLQDRMDETLGWTGLGNCDGGSIGSDTMEVCNFVVDFETAKRTIEEDLKDTEFADYSRIYLED